MDISTDKYESGDNRTGPFLAILQTIRKIVRRLTWLVTLTDEDREKAGIYLGGEGRDG